MAKITMDQWIAEVVNDTSKDGKISAICCYHVEGTREQEVWGTRIKEDEKIDAQQLANIFLRKAQTHVQDIAGFQKFYLKAYYAGRQEYQARLPFQIENANEVSYGTTEPPTAEGRAQQSMRQGEALFTNYMVQATNLANIQNTLIRQLSEDRVKLMTENMEAISVLKEVVLQQAANAHQYRMEEMRYKRESQYIEAGMKIGPALLNSAAGREIIPQPVADSALIETVLDNLKPESIAKLAELGLPQEVMGAIAARATDHWKKKLEAEKLAAENSRNDPILSLVEKQKDAS